MAETDCSKSAVLLPRYLVERLRNEAKRTVRPVSLVCRKLLLREQLQSVGRRDRKHRRRGLQSAGGVRRAIMSSFSQTGIKAHDDACNKSLAQLQAANVGVTSQATLNGNHMTHYRNCLNSAIAKNCGASRSSMRC